MRGDKISFGEYGCLLFISSVGFIGSVLGDILNSNFSDAIIAAVLSFALGVILSIPLFVIKTRGESELAGGGASVLCLYLFYFLISSALDISSAVYLMRNTVFSDINNFLFCLLFVLAVAYCVNLGSGALGRSAQIVLGVMIICSLIILIAGIRHMKFENFRIPFYSGTHDFSRAFWGITARSCFLPQSFILLDYIRPAGRSSKLSKVTALWLSLAGAFIVLSLALVMFCLGDFASTQEFPIFTLTSFLELSPLQRIDIIMGISLLSSLVVRTAATVLCARICIKELKFGAIGTKWIYYSFLALAVLLPGISSRRPALQKNMYPSAVIFILAAILGCIVPFIKLRSRVREERKKL